MPCSDCKHAVIYEAGSPDKYSCTRSIPMAEKNQLGSFPIVEEDWTCYYYLKKQES